MCLTASRPVLLNSEIVDEGYMELVQRHHSKNQEVLGNLTRGGC